MGKYASDRWRNELAIECFQKAYGKSRSYKQIK
jgi:hypothetical protein